MDRFELKENVSLKNLTTFKVGGKARYLAKVKDKKELVDAINFTRKKNIPIFVLGGGSNVLISDKGFGGLVICYVGRKVSFKKIDEEHILVKADAGVIWDKLVELVVKKNLQGIEFLSGIPGTVGASPVQNIGAYGQELKDVFYKLVAYDLKSNKFVKFDRKKCQFGYRESFFKKPENKGRFIITSVTLRLNRNTSPKIKYTSLVEYLDKKGIKKPTLKEVRQAILELRRQKLEDPAIFGNAGSFFKNPIIKENLFKEFARKYPDIPHFPAGTKKIKLFAGWLIEKAGWKGKKYKNAAVSNKNALVIVNPKGQATAREIKELSEKIIEDVYRKFNIKLEPEVQLIGFNEK
jgi:UDP-N-acetylmuramate dehydrogenase